MALTDEGTNTTMLVQPSGFGGNNGFGFGDNGWWIILLFILLGGWGNGFGNGANGFGGNGGLYPWMNQSNQINNGFRDQMIFDNVTGIRDGITGISTQLCNGFAGVAQQMSSNQMADMERSFAVQSAIQNCCCENRAATADLKYTVATENCADRAALADGIRDVVAATQAQTQTILDRLCQDKIDQKNDTIAQLRQELLFARGQASQDVQTAAIQTNNAVTANQLVAELRSCPIPSMPVYGMNPIFTCGSNNGCGCNCGA